MTSWENLNLRRKVRRQGAETTAGDVAHGTDRISRREQSKLSESAGWLRENRSRLQAAGVHPVPVLQNQFHLSSKQCAVVIRMAHELDAKAGSP